MPRREPSRDELEAYVKRFAHQVRVIWSISIAWMLFFFVVGILKGLGIK